MYSKTMKIGNLEIKNRFVRSATFEGMATEEGYVTQQHLELYKTLAEGGVGLIITGHSYIQKNGQAIGKQMSVYNDTFIPGLSKISNSVHEHGNGCKVALQISHCGRQSLHSKKIIAPSAILEQFMNRMPQEMTIEDIEETIEAFAQAARRAKEAGFDAVQLHGAHGYLINQFLSPCTNKRTDNYGGNTGKRFKFIEDIYNHTVELVGKDFPILIKINGDDFLENGIKLEESKKIAKKLSKIGIASIEISGAMWEVQKRRKKELGWKPNLLPEARMYVGTRNEPAYNLPYAKEIKKVINVPIILVGGINSLELVEKILNEESADFISLSRPLIREPDLPNRWSKGIGGDAVACEYCNKCISIASQTGLRCVKKEN